MNPINWYLRLLLALFIIVGLVMRYNFGLETFELRWVESGFFNWLIVPFAIRITAFFEVLVIGLLVFASFSKKNWIIWLSGIFLIYFLDLIFGIQNVISSNYPYFFFSSPLLSIIALITFTGITVLFLFQSHTNPPFKIKSWVFVTILPILWIGVFFMNHLSLEQFKLKTTPYKNGVSDWTAFEKVKNASAPEFNSNNHFLVAFFSTHCEICHWNAMKLEAAANYYKNKNKILLVFFEPKEEITFFLNATQIKAPYIELPPSIVANLVGDGFPAFIEFKDQKVVQDFSPNELNYVELHRIFTSHN